MSDAVRATEDFERIANLPRRRPTFDELNQLAVDFTDALKTDAGAMVLRRLQALALAEAGTLKGAFIALDVGQGKTLISLMVAALLDAMRPLFVLPAQLIQKTALEREELARHWLLPNHVRLMSYQILGRKEYAGELEKYGPDLLIFDESHKLKNPDAAVTRRVQRYLDAHPETMVVAMTGTIMRASIRDFAHILRWCLGKNAPVPLSDDELFEWCSALDEQTFNGNEFDRYEPGALMRFADANDPDFFSNPRAAARRGYKRRLADTPGVIVTGDEGEKVDIPIELNAVKYNLSATTAGHFKKLREDMITPDDWQLWTGVEVWQHARELALGFHQVWDPRPPDDWRKARKEWFSFARAIILNGSTYDSPDHVAQACDAGYLPAHKLNAWRAIQDSYQIKTKAIWHDDGALLAAARWMSRGPGIVWTEHVPFAVKLAEMTGATYYGAKGLSADGLFVDHAPEGSCVIVSADANKEGRNLQKKWNRNLITSVEEGADKLHQLIGRTHRPGQDKSLVTVDVFLGCAEHARAMARARISARSIRDTVGSEQKLLIAKFNWPDDIEIASWSGPRWAR